jgi:Cys-tRNA(Pro)/Cys-tRNA(Cys) deacylase
VASPTPASRALDCLGIPYRLHTFEADPAAGAYGPAAAAALGIDGDRVYKTLLAVVDGLRVPAAVGVVPVTGSLDLRRFAAACGGKRAAMATPDVAERLTGFVLGGISPVGQRRALPTVVDESARTHGTVFVSGGRRGLELELAPDDLVRATGATWASIAG